MQCAVIEYARNVCLLKDANSTEFDEETAHPVIDLMPGQRNVEDKGASMRLGDYACELKSGTKVAGIYQRRQIHERHRHRYEVNNQYSTRLEEGGMVLCGRNLELNLVEMIELPGHPWFIGVQFHPELKSRIIQAHPLFRDFMRAAVEHKAQSI